MHRTTDGLRGSRRRDVEVAATALIRSVLEPAWSATEAGGSLYERVHGDRIVLTILRARAARELSRGWTPLGQRAAATVEAALAVGSTDAGRPRTLAEQATPPQLAGTAA